MKIINTLQDLFSNNWSKILLGLSFLTLMVACSPECPIDTANQDFTDTYFVDSWTGNDDNDGRSPATAWKSLERASQQNYGPGEKLLLSKGRTFEGKLYLKVSGSSDEPFVVSAYESNIGADSLPLIDAAGYRACVQVENGSHFVISNLELTADAGVPVDAEARTERYGVLVTADKEGTYPGVTLENLNIHDIFATESIEKDGQNPTSNMGLGIAIFMRHASAKIRDVLIEGCNITRTGHTGIRIFGAHSEATGNVYLENIQILNNYLKQVGGPGMVPGRCQNLLVRGNITDDTGSDVDPRMHNRGSGIWPWTSKDVLIEHNRFMHAFGKYDSHGAHIDFNCENVVVQYNLSINNHGGFVEILGNDKNCAYRYNISINDGWRNEGELGAKAEGNTLWFSGYTGSNNPRIGPHNSYVYNNTVFIKADQRTCFSVISNTDGAFIANNIFYILGKTEDDSDHAKDPETGEPATPKRIVFENNLYASVDVIPEELTIQDTNPIIGDPEFKNPGGFNPQDYIPGNVALIKDTGLVPQKLEGDPLGLTVGLQVETDILGNPIKGLPDMGAIELQ